MYKAGNLLMALVLVSVASTVGVLDTSYSATYPEKPIEIIVAWPPGGGADLATRTVAAYAEKELGQRINIVNLTGGGGAIGYNRAKSAKADGYTLINIQSELVSLEAQKLAPVSRADFIPIMAMASQSAPLIARVDSPWKTFEEFVAKCKQNPAKYNVGGSPLKSIFHFAAALLMDRAGIQFNYVPTGGSPETLAAVAGGHVDTAFMWLSGADSYIRSGQMRGLVVFADKRLDDYPDVPTLKEKGIDLTYQGYYGVGVPKGTPPDVVNILERAFTRAYNNPSCQEELRVKQKLELMYLNSPQFRVFLEQEYGKIQKGLQLVERK